MIRKPSRIGRQWTVFKSAFGTTGELTRNAWAAKTGGRRWMIPLIVFLCLNGLLLTLAAGVEALAPFVYSIF
jgi:hypothetical protein